MRFGIKELIFVLLMAGLVASSYIFVFKPAAEKRTGRERDIADRQKALADLKTATTGIGDLEKKIADLQQAIIFFESKLPQEKEIDKILKEVWQMAEANQLTTKTIKTMKAQRGPNYSEQPIQLSLSGDFNGFYAFLLQVEKLQRITRITDMTLQKISDRDGEMQAQMTLSIFFEPDTGSKVAGAN